MLNEPQLTEYQDKGHLTINDFYGPATVALVIDEINIWADETRAVLSAEDQRWYFEKNVPKAHLGTEHVHFVKICLRMFDSDSLQLHQI